MSMVSERPERAPPALPNRPLPSGFGSPSWSRRPKPSPRPSNVSASSVFGEPESTTSLPLCEYTCTRVWVVSAAAWAHLVRSCTVVSGGGSATMSLALAVRYESSALE